MFFSVFRNGFSLYTLAVSLLILPVLALLPGCSDSSPAAAPNEGTVAVTSAVSPTTAPLPTERASRETTPTMLTPTTAAEIAPPAQAGTQPVPTVTPLPGIGPLGHVEQFTEENLPPAPDRDLFQLAYQLLLPEGYPEVSPVVNTEPVSYEAGRVDEFYLVDLQDLEKYRSTFELRLVSPHAYWYVEEGLRVDQGDLERSAREFEEVIYPRVTDYFGTEWTPGVDNDPT